MFSPVTRLLGLLALMVAANAAMAVDEVKLISTRSNECPPVSGCFHDTFFNGTIEVKNLAYSKQVELYYKKSDGTWAVQAASYFGPSTAGKELWLVSLPAPSTSFAVKYAVNGQTYWDNNNGSNYSAARYQFDANLGYPAISDAQGGYQVASGGSAGYVKGSILVKNLSPTKTISVTYTDDNWATTKQAKASYTATLPSGVEYWEYTLPLAYGVDHSKIKMAFQYTWPSGSTWDNNFGKNYRLVNDLISR